MAHDDGKTIIYPRGNALREAGMLALITLLLALLSWALRPPRLPLCADLELYELDLGFSVTAPATALGFYESDSHWFIDTRPSARADLLLPKAFVIRQETFDDDLRKVFDFLMPEDPLVVFGDGNLVMLAALATRLHDRGFEDITIMSGTMETWQAAGGETSPAPHMHGEAPHE